MIYDSNGFFSFYLQKCLVQNSLSFKLTKCIDKKMFTIQNNHGFINL